MARAPSMHRWGRAAAVAVGWLAAAIGSTGVQAAPSGASAGVTAAAVSVRDDRGIDVTLPAPARRIVSLLPSLTETVCALGACARLVGTDRFSNHPASVLALPKLGGIDDAQVEAVVALKPDLVLVATSTRALDRFEGLGLTVVALEPRSLADVKRVLGQVATLVGSSHADALWRQMQHEVDAATRQLEPAARGLSVYHEVASGPYAAGAASFTGELMTRLGLQNIVPAGLGPFPKLNPEFVVRADPALVLMSHTEADELAARPGWARIRALREQRVCRFDASASDVLSRPGPRIGEAAAVLVRCINAAVARVPASRAGGLPLALGRP
jgi:iron complex transport system substrate-binding protein